MNISIIGSGFQGLTQAATLSVNHEIRILQTEEINESLIKQFDIDFFKLVNSSYKKALCNADIVIISVLVPYDTELNIYLTNNIDKYINYILEYSPKSIVVLRSDVPVGYCNRIKAKYPSLKLLFVPNFARETSPFEDTLNPSRLIIGGGSQEDQRLIYRLLSGTCPVVFTNTDEAESVKLFANSYLAMRVAYFNELDTYAEIKGLNSIDIIKSVSLDPRIGDIYNNPSFGYGGRYLTESSCRLKNDFIDLPEKMVDMVEISNDMRKDHITNMIMKRNPEVCGIYGLGMKTGSKDFRYSAVEGIIKRLQAKGVRIIIYEPMIDLSRYLSADVVNDFNAFINASDVIVANRIDDKIKQHIDKVYTRDLFERD